MSRAWLPFTSGLLFSLGLVVSGMTQPQKVIAFLDVSGRWDPSLALVMVGAIAVHALGLRLGRRRLTPPPTARRAALVGALADRRMLLGSALFGVGWGLSGYCPGPAVVSAASGTPPTVATLGAMLAGIGLGELASSLAGRGRSEPTCAEVDTA